MSEKPVNESITLDGLIDNIHLNKIQKDFLAILYVLITIIIVAILEFTKHFRGVKLSISQLNFSSDIQMLLLFLQLFFCFALTPFTIYDIYHDNFFKNVKTELPLMLIVSAIIAFLPSLILFIEDTSISIQISNYAFVLTKNAKILYLGVEPEVFIAGLIFTFVLYYSPFLLILKYYQRIYSSLESIQSTE